MNYFSALALVLGIASALISIYEFIRRGSWRPGVAYSIAAVILIVAAVVVANLPSPSGSQASGVPSIQNSSTSQAGTSVTPTPTQVPPTQVPSPIPSPTPTPHDEKMEWTTNWSDWGATGDNWYISGNSLMATGNGQMIITAPLVPIAADYAVEVDITVDNVNHSAYYGGFGIVVRSSGGHGGYALSMCYAGGWNSCEGSGDHAAILSAGCDFTQYVVGGENCSVLGTTPYHAPNQVKLTYRLEVQGNNIRAFVKGGPLFPTTVDNNFHTSGQICLFSQNIGLTVTRFTYIPLS